MRERQINVRMSSEEYVRLLALAKHYGATTSHVVRTLIGRDHDEKIAKTWVVGSAPEAAQSAKARGQ